MLLLCDRVFDAEFCSLIGDEKINIAEAVGLVDLGEEANEETMVEFSKDIFGASSTTVIKLPQSALDYMNTHKVGGVIAKFLHYFFPICFVAGFLCLLCGVGFPFRIGRGNSLFDICDKAVGADPTNTYIVSYRDSNGFLNEYTTYSGETKSAMLWLFLLFVYFILIFVWGSLIVPVILIDIVIAACIGLVKLIIMIVHKITGDKTPKTT
ncbi:MAG: hypothetical protein MR434_02950 [Ruminococcus sp.]|nr:hypothetical protein [Ruminococcus sp.]